MERTTKLGAATALRNALRKTLLAAGILAAAGAATNSIALSDQPTRQTIQYERQLENSLSQQMRNVDLQVIGDSYSIHNQEQSEVSSPASKPISHSIAMIRGNEVDAIISVRLSEESRLNALRCGIRNLLGQKPKKYVSDYVSAQARQIEQSADAQVASIKTNANNVYVALESNPQQPDTAVSSRPKR